MYVKVDVRQFFGANYSTLPLLVLVLVLLVASKGSNPQQMAPLQRTPPQRAPLQNFPRLPLAPPRLLRTRRRSRLRPPRLRPRTSTSASYECQH
jgi:hypothetical protein